MVELRKRPPPPPAQEKAARKKSKKGAAAAAEPEASSSKDAEAPAEEKTLVEQATDTLTDAAAATAETIEAAATTAAKAVEDATNGSVKPPTPASLTGAPKKGDTITLSGFGGEVQTHDGSSTTLEKLVEESKAGVVLFTYPKASTPGCTKQACLFRDEYSSLTSTGLSVYGLSNDTSNANNNFKSKYKFPYTLLCDKQRTLIQAIGMKKSATQTTRGVFVVDKHGKVLAAEAAGPEPSVEAVRQLVKEMGGAKEGEAEAEKMEGVEGGKIDKEMQGEKGDKEDTEKAAVAGEVADAAKEAKLDASAVGTPAS